MGEGKAREVTSIPFSSKGTWMICTPLGDFAHLGILVEREVLAGRSGVKGVDDADSIRREREIGVEM